MNARLALLTVFLYAVAGPAAAGAEEADLDLQLLPTTSMTNRLRVSLDLSGITDSELTRVSGNILTTIDYDLYLGEPLVKGIEFTGGNLRLRGATTDDVNFDLRSLGTNIDVDGSNLGGKLTTPMPPSLVTDGTFDAADQLLVLDSGLLTAAGTAFFIVPVSEMVDLSQQNIVLPTAATWTVAIDLTSSSGRTQNYDVTVTLPVDATYPVAVSDTTTLDVDARGTIVARDSFTLELPLEGDYNRDGTVGLADYTAWRDSLGATGPGLAADGNFDWRVDHEDYQLWTDHFGATLAAPALAATAVPEPTSVLLAGLGFLLCAAGDRAAKCRDARAGAQTPRR